LSTLRVLSEFKILSAPVISKSTNDLIGVIDILDLVAFVTEKLRSRTQKPEEGSLIEDVLIHKLENLLGASNRSKYIRVFANESLAVLFGLLSDKDIHRVIVLNDTNDKEITAVLSQSSVIHWLTTNMSHLEVPDEKGLIESHKWKSIPVKDFARLQSVKMFAKEEKVMEAFNCMYYNKISAVPVVTNDGTLWETLSASDLKGILNDPLSIWNLLQGSISTFLLKSKRESLCNPQWTCEKEDPMSSVLSKLSVSGVHRLWVVNETSQPIGVVSLCDIIAIFSKC